MGLTGLGKASFYYPSLTTALIPDSVTISHSFSCIKSNLLAVRPQLLLSIPIRVILSSLEMKPPSSYYPIFKHVHLNLLPKSFQPPVTHQPFFPCAHCCWQQLSPDCSDLQSPFLLCSPSCLKRGFRWRTQVTFTNNTSKQSSKEIKVGHMKSLS